MAVSGTIEKVQGKMLLVKSTDPQTGVVTTVTVSLPTLSTTATAQQIYNMARLARNCLTKTLYSVQQVVTSTIEDNE